MGYLPYTNWLRLNWVSLIPFTLLAITGIIISFVHMGNKKAYPVFSLVAYILSLLNQWVINYIQWNVLYTTRSLSDRNEIIITNALLNLIGGIFLLIAIFSGRKTRNAAPQYPPYPIYPQASQPAYPSYVQPQYYPPYPQQFPQQPPQPPQNPPSSNP